jgi:peptide methionine sulfoxide reductase msrA/msrB
MANVSRHRFSLIAQVLFTTLILGAGTACADSTGPTPATPQTEGGKSPELKKRLTPLQYRVTQLAETEPPYHNDYFDNHADGIYVDVVNGTPLFSSKDKFESGTGWPSFTRPLDPSAVALKTDNELGMARTEVRTASSDSHLGHVFDDGPAPTGKRFCMNSASLRFVPAKDLAKEGYPEYVALFPKKPEPKKVEKVAPMKTETAYLAGGCFWGVQHLLRKQPGIVTTEVGYTNGKTGEKEKAESVKIVFDPARTSYSKILEYFYKLHDPTHKDRQGNDIGAGYRSAIFYLTDTQKKEAEAAKKVASEKWKAPATTEIVEFANYTKADEDHQDYLVKHPNGYTCHYVRNL